MELREQADLLLSYHDGDDRCGCLRTIVTGLLDEELTLSRLVDLLSTCLSEHPAGTSMRRDFGRNMSHWVTSVQRPLQRDDSERSSGLSSVTVERSHEDNERTYEESPQLGSEHDTKQRAQETHQKESSRWLMECSKCDTRHTGSRADVLEHANEHYFDTAHNAAVSLIDVFTVRRPGIA